MKKTAIIICFILGIPSVTNADWKKYETTDFTIFSDARERTVRRRIEEFKTIKDFSEVIFPFSAPAFERTPLRIFIFDNRRDFNDLISQSNVAGFFVNGLVSPFMMIGPRSQETVLYHEYTHYLMSYGSQTLYPTWYSEGLAEIMSTLSVKFGEISFGAVPDRYLILQQLGPTRSEGLLNDSYDT